MLQTLSFVRRDERRHALGAFLTLFALMAGHTLLETGRDALFLERLPASNLPWVYLGIAAVAVALATVGRRGGGICLARIRRRYVLALSGGMGVNLLFWALLVRGTPGDWIYYALYVWGGVFASLAAVLFWSLAGGMFTTTQAKRLYGPIGAGSVAGAVTGTAIASVMTTLAGTEHLLGAAAVFVGLAAWAPLVFLRGLQNEGEGCEAGMTAAAEVPVGAIGRLAETLCVIRTRPYLQWLGVLVFVAALTATVVDYVFKSTLAMMVTPETLAVTLARFYLVLNSVALLVQVIGVGWLVRRAGVVRGLGLLPLLLVAGGGVLLFGPLLLSALILKGIDGALRHSLHRTALEILYVPLTTRVRALAKPMIDVLGQRGGQAAASLLLLLAIDLGWGRVGLALTVLVLALLWVALVLKLEKPYVGLFRATLQGLGSGAEFALPSLDLGSLERLLETLNSDDDREVIAALELLAEQGRAHVIPALILYHPSPAVVERALAIFSATRRNDYLRLARRLLEHPAPRVRAAAIRALVRHPLERELLERALHDISPAVRAAAWVGLVAVGALAGEEAERRRRELVDLRHPEVAIALAEAIRAQPHGRFEGLLLELAETRSSRVRRAVAQAMSSMPTPRFLPTLTSMLADRGSRADARRTLVSMGDEALEHLARTLADRGVARRIRRHLPRTISRFSGAKAVPILMPYLVDEADDMVRFRVLRALAQIRSEEPQVKLDPVALGRARDELLAIAFRLRAGSAALRRLRAADAGGGAGGAAGAAGGAAGGGADGAAGGAAGGGTLESEELALQQLLEELLVEQEANVLERLFRVLALLNPGEDFLRLLRGLRSRRREIRSSSIELLNAVLLPPVREAVLALVDERPEAEWWAIAARYGLPPERELDRDQLLAILTRAPNEMLRGLAAHYAQWLERRSGADQEAWIEPLLEESGEGAA